MRSFARARSSSRRAPPIAASNWCSSIASSSVVVCRRLRDARGPVSSTTRPLSIDSCTEATIRRSPSSATRRSRNSITSGKLWPVSTCMTGNGNLPGRNAFSARRSSTIESLPPEKSSTGRSSSAATSRKMWIASASRSSRCVSVRRASCSCDRSHGDEFELLEAREHGGRRLARAHGRSCRARSSGSLGASYGSETPVKSLDLAGERLRVETLRVARARTPRATSRRRSRRTARAPRRASARDGASPRTARSRRRRRRRRRARGARRPSRCARCSCRGPPSRSRGPSRDACARRRRRARSTTRPRCSSSRRDDASPTVVLPGGREAREPDDEAAHALSSTRCRDLGRGTVWMPHSTLSVPAQRPERPAPGCVECVSPIESYPWSCSGLYGSPRARM